MKSTLFTDPYSGHEVLLIEGIRHAMGAAYDPRKKGIPHAWHGGCPHCRSGRSELGIHLRRQIEMLGSQRFAGHTRARSPIFEYDLPLSEDKIRYWHSEPEQKATLLRKGEILASASKLPGEKIILDGPSISTVSMRCLRFLMSARPATPEEILACARPLAIEQKRISSLPGRRTACHGLIDWEKIARRAQGRQDEAP